ncbi:MAG TPA: hypothetical protein VIV37_08240 [Gaiellaceae bacterium]
MNGDFAQTKPVPAFIGVSSTEGEGADRDETPTLAKAIDRAAQLAAEDGHAGHLFHVTIEVIPEAHNQWVRTFRAIITAEN